MVSPSTIDVGLLLRVSEALVSTDDPDEAVGQLARVIVPELADWSFITVIDEGGKLRDIGLAHRDPDRMADMQVYADCHLENMTEVAAVSIGLRTGQSVVVPHLDDTMLASFLPDPEVAYVTRRLDPYGVAVFPLQAGGRTFGVLVSATTSARGSHTPADLAALLEVARRAGPVLGLARSAQRSRMLAETMQRSLLTVSPPGPSLEAAVRYRPAYSDREVGGDWYDIVPLSDGSTVVTMGDVMGHDLAAIASMAQLRSFMRANAWQVRHSPAEMLAATDAVSAGLGPGTFATALAVDFAPPTPDGWVPARWSTAGHPPAAVIAPDGSVSFLGQGTRPDPPLGVAPGERRTDRECVLPPGTTVVLYTDGLVERRGRVIDEGLDELARHLEGTAGRPLQQLVDDVIAAMDVGDTHDDDLAVMAVRIKGSAALLS